MFDHLGAGNEIVARGECGPVVERFYPLERFPQKTLYLLDDLLAARNVPGL
jgi:hypothetical protein